MWYLKTNMVIHTAIFMVLCSSSQSLLSVYCDNSLLVKSSSLSFNILVIPRFES